MSTEPKSRLHLSALKWAAQGFHVFPILPLRKEPAVKDWEAAATTDAAQIDVWWTQNPLYNIGFAPGRSGSTVVDVDPPLGFETLKALPALPDTFTIKSPRGGVHLYFDGDGPTSVGTEKRGLGPKIDTRGIGGYVLVPPSVIGPGEYANNPNGGNYDYENQTEIAEVPEWVALRIDNRKERHTAAEDTALDQGANVARARRLVADYIAAGDIAVQGAGGDDRTYRLCAEVANFGLSADVIADIVKPWNAACQPPWEDEELAGKIANALSYAQNEQGAWAVQDPAEAFKDYIQNAGHAGEVLKPSRFRPLKLSEARDAKAPSWLIPELLQANSLAVFYGRQKSFKSFLALDLCLGISAGVETFNQTPKRACVVYAVGEGQWNISHAHAPSWLLARQVADEPDFWLVPTVPKVIFGGDDGDAVQLIKAIRARGLKPAVVVIDTMARSIGGLDENSAKDVGTFVAACDFIREQLDCTVLVIHHSGKDKTKGTRGSGALDAAADTVVEVERHEKTMYVSATVKDQRNAPEREKPFFFEGRKIGPSLAFFPIHEATFAAAAASEHITSKKHVAAALVRMGAKGEANGVSTAALASNMAVHHGDVDPKELEKVLNKSAKKSPLNAYCAGEGSALRWYII
jgi:hypothetical protein